jgi:hypothetical protein
MNRNDLRETVQLQAAIIIGFGFGQFVQWTLHLSSFVSICLIVAGVIVLTSARAITTQGKDRLLVIVVTLAVATISIVGFWGSWRF